MADQSRVALVTGASRAISPYIARSLAGAAYRLILTGRSASELNALANELNAVAVPADLTSPDELEALVEVAERELGGVDVLVNNAGGDPQREFDAMSWPDNASILELNLIAPMRLTHRLLPGMLRCGRGHVVNTSSIAGRVSFPLHRGLRGSQGWAHRLHAGAAHGLPRPRSERFRGRARGDPRRGPGPAHGRRART